MCFFDVGELLHLVQEDVTSSSNVDPDSAVVVDNELVSGLMSCFKEIIDMLPISLKLQVSPFEGKFNSLFIDAPGTVPLSRFFDFGGKFWFLKLEMCITNNEKVGFIWFSGKGVTEDLVELDIAIEEDVFPL